MVNKKSTIMATTQKNFQLSVDFFDRPDICAVTVEHGIKGQAATIMLLCAIYKNGYFIEWKPENYLVILKELPGIKIKKMEKIVKTLVEWGFFDKTAFDVHQVLTSREIQLQYLESQENNLTDVDALPYWLTNDNENDNDGCGNNGNDNDGCGDNGNNTNKKRNGKKQNVKSQVRIGDATVDFPANPRECIPLLKEDQHQMNDIWARYYISKPEKREESILLFVHNCEKESMDIFDCYEDVLECFDYWLKTGHIKTMFVPKTMT